LDDWLVEEKLEEKKEKPKWKPNPKFEVIKEEPKMRQYIKIFKP